MDVGIWIFSGLGNQLNSFVLLVLHKNTCPLHKLTLRITFFSWTNTDIPNKC